MCLWCWIDKGKGKIKREIRDGDDQNWNSVCLGYFFEGASTKEEWGVCSCYNEGERRITKAFQTYCAKSGMSDCASV